MSDRNISSNLENALLTWIRSNTWADLRDAFRAGWHAAATPAVETKAEPDGSAKCPHCQAWRTAAEIGKGMCCDKDVPPNETSLNGLKSWGLSPNLPTCSLVITFESVDTAIEAREKIGARFGFPMRGSAQETSVSEDRVCQPTLTVCPTCNNDLTKCVGPMRIPEKASAYCNDHRCPINSEHAHWTDEEGIRRVRYKVTGDEHG